MLCAMDCLGLQAPLRLPPIFYPDGPLRKSELLKIMTEYIPKARDQGLQIILI